MSSFVLLSSGPDWAEYWRPILYLSRDEQVQARVNFVEGQAEIIIYVTSQHGTRELYREFFTESEAQAVLDIYGVEP